MYNENGRISIHTENIFPIIKKWLYSDMDIFVRELISNGCDAISKFKRLVSIKEAEAEDGEVYRVTVSYNEKEKWIKFIDNGLGMTADEVKKYINQVAFSGAADFIEKYKDKLDEANQIIGHFGLGFYSAFMVSEKVQIDTKSYLSDAEAVRWVCTGGTDYEMTQSDRETRGTTVTLYLSEDNLEFLKEYKLREIIQKHCSFLPIEIYLENDEKTESTEEKKEEPKPLNDIHPLWMKNPKDCTDEEYKEFYHKVFDDYNDPLFWIHLNVDFPFNLKGILYFPKLKNEFEYAEGQIKLYNNQVYVADNIKEIIPEFLLLLKGTIDCADLPLNVSRSFLQKDKNVIKISSHISSKVADKLKNLYNNERDNYNSFWEDINPFIKYGCLKDHSFYDKVKDIIIFKNLKGEYITLKDYTDNNKEKHENKVFYVTDENQQSQYIKLFKDNDLDAVMLNTPIDNHFISFLEMNSEGVKFNRIDSEISDTIKSEADDKEAVDSSKLEGIFKEAVASDKLKFRIESLRTKEIPAVMILSEQSRRMQEMSRMFSSGMDESMFPKEETLVINSSNELVKMLSQMSDDRKDDINMISRHIYDLAMLSYKQMSPEEMTEFINRSNSILAKAFER